MKKLLTNQTKPKFQHQQEKKKKEPLKKLFTPSQKNANLTTTPYFCLVLFAPKQSLTTPTKFPFLFFKPPIKFLLFWTPPQFFLTLPKKTTYLKKFHSNGISIHNGQEIQCLLSAGFFLQF